MGNKIAKFPGGLSMILFGGKRQRTNKIKNNGNNSLKNSNRMQ